MGKCEKLIGVNLNTANNISADLLNACVLEGVESKIDAGIKIGAGSGSYTERNYDVVSMTDTGITNGGGSEINAGSITGVESEIDAGIDIENNAGVPGALSQAVNPVEEAGEYALATDSGLSEPEVEIWIKENAGNGGVESELVTAVVAGKRGFFAKKVNVLAVVAGVALCAAIGLSVFNWAQKNITLSVDGKKIITKTFASNVQELIEQKKIKLNEKDRLIPQPDTKLTDGLEVAVIRALPVSIDVAGEKLEITSSAQNVKQLIDEQKIGLNERDEVIPALNEKLSPGMKIQVTRVEQKTIEKEVQLAYRTETRYTPSLSRGITRISRAGKAGTEKQIWQVTYRNGEEVSSQMVGSQIVSTPVSKIVDYGTKQQTIDRSGQTYQYSQEMYVIATAYTYTGRNTASGIPPSVGSVAVDPRVIPIGTRLYIEGYGYGRAVDTGGSIKGNKVDVFLESEQQCRKWGVRKVKVYVLG
ncbi:3D domain protein [Desulfofarcimen acetoxidans DSM 771]|jgi:uncharacterized protein YabE (DUF348 family)|uniref:3D domain protein n=1 Tax=Desulfofarcimen acetoxidans (strain ATCC 49208 / DSM 771 / KCTC 5769 / VKM B-1644 / 5575) TaxID=485916 RepID=C8W2R6_DESAS|nr:3D domain-containing protein [Desulfofarcimen acetoxidans]ACV61072.1 3D domain protein [Desulfofarcimen acetoxidans DSM 771]